MASKFVTLFLYLGLFVHFTYAVPERGIKEMVFDKKLQYKSFAKSLFKDAKITISGILVTKDGKSLSNSLSLNWYLLRSDCAQYFVQVKENVLPTAVAQEQHTHKIYNSGIFTFKKGSLHNKTTISLEREIHTNVEVSDVELTSDLEQGSSNLKTSAAPKMKTTRKAAEATLKPKDKTTPKPKDKIPLKPKDKATLKPKDKTTPKPKDKTISKPKDKTTRGQSKQPSTKPHERKKREDKGEDKEEEKEPEATEPPKQAGLDGNYLLVISLEEELPKDVSIQVKVSIKMNTGYLSAAEWPLLPFYGAMSLVYLSYGVVWLIISACQWRELLRIQFWIGGVIALGMLEKAVLFSEYNNVNDTGIPAHGLVVLALVLSCIKRTLSRILIIIVSMGFGIVKPRLGGALHRVLGVGCLYFILSLIEGSYREFSVKADVNRKQVIASVPLSVLDAVICWWIFMSLLHTMRTLRIRKNVVKLSLYRHFTNILVVSVIASVAFMVWVIKAHSFNSCIKDWKEIWIDDAFWHFLFALILLAIMVLWRPTVNNQRYAFTPLIDVGEEDDDDMTLSDAFQGMKMRGKGENETPSRAEKQRKKAEDDLKWVEENIPTSGGIDTALPSLLDSDEEMMTTKLEMNKME